MLDRDRGSARERASYVVEWKRARVGVEDAIVTLSHVFSVPIGVQVGRATHAGRQECSQASGTGQDQRSVFGRRTNLHPDTEKRGDIL